MFAPWIDVMGQQCLRVIRVWASVPQTSLFGPAVPSNYSSSGFGPSKLSLRASSAFELFEFELRSLEILSSGQQCLRIIQVRASVPRTSFFGPAVPSNYSSSGSSPSNFYFGLSTLFTQNTRILVAKYQFGCRMSNTKVSPWFTTPDGPIFVSSALCREIFHTYGMKFAPMDASGASQ
jgi:hypothetical protein